MSIAKYRHLTLEEDNIWEALVAKRIIEKDVDCTLEDFTIVVKYYPSDLLEEQLHSEDVVENWKIAAARELLDRSLLDAEKLEIN